MSESTAVQPGHLYVVATPIGHLGDLSPRAAAVLGAVDAILAEDTRTSAILLQHLGLQRPLIALHEHNERERAEGLLQGLREGRSLALISDAGTPLISDPGFVLVRAVRDAGLPVITVPGPCALIAALSIAGLPTDRFRFIGFLPARAAARRSALEALRSVPETWACYESSHRIADCLDDLVTVIGGERPAALARELTKRFEQSVQRPLAQLRDWLAEDPQRQRGEFVLVIAGAAVMTPTADTEADPDPAATDRLLRLLLTELPASRAARLAADISGRPRKALYTRALEMKPD
jgi:16S rRNA (cytidine1402-2'-O)-methyltransferase